MVLGDSGNKAKIAIANRRSHALCALHALSPYVTLPVDCLAPSPSSRIHCPSFQSFHQKSAFALVRSVKITTSTRWEVAVIRGHVDWAFIYSLRQGAWPHQVFVSDRLEDRKSVFQAHATPLRDSSALPIFIDYLTSSQNLRRATHCMYAYRSTERVLGLDKLTCGHDDGGEHGSGDRLSRLLELSNCENVVVVVSRWYGRTKLGSARWRHISQVAKEALNKGGFMKQGNLQEIATTPKRK